MRTTTMRKTAALAAVTSLALFTAACGSDDESSSDSSSDSSTSEATEDAADPAANLVGSGCADYAAQVPDGAGSVAGMAQDNVSTAASNNPLLTTLVKAVSGQVNPAVNLVDTLDGGEFTVFAPVDSAFAALPAGTVDTLAAEEGGATLSSILTYHVIPGRIEPKDIDGTFKTVNGADLTVTGEGDNITVGANNAKVICGGVQTANATVYLIDSVLTPPAS